jgi:hypothetical protein
MEGTEGFLGRRLRVDGTEGFFSGLVGEVLGLGGFFFSRSLSIFLAPGCLLLGLLGLPGNVGIDIPNLIIMPRFACLL